MPDSLMEKASDPARVVKGVRTTMDAAHARGKLIRHLQDLLP